MKTAVQWLIEQWPILESQIPERILEQAKEMEKEQIIDAHFTSSGCNSFDVETDRVNSAYKAAQIYYQETYEQN
jgi:hypothetical protein